MQYKNLVTELMFVDRACNFRCKYCTAPLKPIPVQNGVYTLAEYGGEIIELDAAKDKKLGIRMRAHYSRALEITPTPILSVIGGELTLIRGLAEFLVEISHSYELIILTTNGSRLDKSIIEILSKCKNLLLYLSLDGYKYDMNSYRVPNEKISNQILESLEYCLKMGIKVEVQTVLHDRNIEQIKEFADYLLKYSKLGHYIKLVPFPVRWTQGKYSPLQSDLSELRKLYEEHEYYQDILPPKAYIANLLGILETGKRTTRCLAPYFVNGIDDRGRLKSCPCVPIINSSIHEKTEKVRDDIEKAKEVYKDREVYSGFCHTCFEGAWEMLNAYLQGTISKSELQRMQIGKTPNVIGVLDQIKERVSKDRFFNNMIVE